MPEQIPVGQVLILRDEFDHVSKQTDATSAVHLRAARMVALLDELIERREAEIEAAAERSAATSAAIRNPSTVPAWNLHAAGRPAHARASSRGQRRPPMNRNPEALQKTEPRRLVLEVVTLLLAETPHAHSISNLVLNGVPVPEDECAAAVAIVGKERHQ